MTFWAWARDGARNMHAFELAEVQVLAAQRTGTVHTALCNLETGIGAKPLGHLDGPMYGRCPGCWRRTHPMNALSFLTASASWAITPPESPCLTA